MSKSVATELNIPVTHFTNPSHVVTTTFGSAVNLYLLALVNVGGAEL